MVAKTKKQTLLSNNSLGDEPQSIATAQPVIADDVEELFKKPLATRNAARQPDEEDEAEEVPAEEETDEWEKAEEDEDWDPDFDEFDIPKSTKKGGRKGIDDDDDYKTDDEFKDLFGDSSAGFDEDDENY